MHQQRLEAHCPYITWKCRGCCSSFFPWKQSPKHYSPGWPQNYVAQLQGHMDLYWCNLTGTCLECVTDVWVQQMQLLFSMDYNFASSIKKRHCQCTWLLIQKANLKIHMLPKWLRWVWFHDSAMYSSYWLVNLCGWVRTLPQAQIFLLYVFFCFAQEIILLVSSDSFFLTCLHLLMLSKNICAIKY